jgi:hypothetical protein
MSLLGRNYFIDFCSYVIICVNAVVLFLFSKNAIIYAFIIYIKDVGHKIRVARRSHVSIH